MSQEAFVIRNVNMPADADKLVEMWRASDDQWPGTWSGGVEITRQMVLEWFEREKILDAYVAETADGSKIVGYGSLHRRESDKNTGYLDLLNVQPDYQKKSLGRRLVQRIVQRCIELGFRLVTIGTWSGNLKSVPTYKKCGYYWMPDTSVYMFNYIPAIRNLPCAHAYFSRHDWYKTFKRELKQEEDDERWEGMKVFTYRWAADGDSLTAWADREAQQLTAVETGTFFAGAIAGDIEPAKGMSTTIRWRVTNKQDRPMSVSLIASGTEHIKVDKRATFTVAPGETYKIEAPVDVALDTPDVKGEKPVPSVRTICIIDGEVVELGTGFRPQKAVEVSLAPAYVTLFPGVAKTVHVQLQSHLKEDVEATVSLAPAPGLSTGWTEATISIPAKSYAALPVTLQANAGGVYPLLATVYFEGGATKPERLAIFALPTSGVLADKGEKETRLENEWTRVTIQPKSGAMHVSAVHSGAQLMRFRESIGPPFWPSELDEKHFDIALQEANGRITARLTVHLEDHPGVTLQRDVTVGGGPLVEIAHALLNKSTEAQHLQLQYQMRPRQEDRATVTLPLKDGIVQSRKCEFPAAEEDVDKKPGAFVERWAAYSSDLGTFGVLWEAGLEETEIGWGLYFVASPFECAPQQWQPAGTLWLYAGPGDWRTVHAHARRLAGTDGEPEPIPVEVREVHGVRWDSTPLLALDDEVAANLVVDNLRGRSLEGKIDLTMPDGGAVDRDAFEIAGVNLKQTLSENVTIALPQGAAAYEADALLQTRLFDKHIPLPVIRLGTRDAVDVVEADGVFTIDNGRTAFAVAPGYSAALVRWEEDGVNHILSPYPEQKTFDWISPWYGGMMPIAIRPGDWDFPGKLHKESLTGGVVDLTDAGGIPWCGVRVSCAMQRERLLGLSVDIDYLTVGGSNVLKVIYRVTNSTTAKRPLEIGWLSFWQPDGDSAHNVLHADGLQRKPNAWDSWAETKNWAAVTNGETGRTLMQVSPYPNVRYIDWGSGGHLAWMARVDVPPEGVLERVVYLALSPSLEAAKQYIPLKDVK